MRRCTELATPAPEVPRGPRVTLTASMKSMLQAADAQQLAQAQQAVRRSSPGAPLGTAPLDTPPIISQWQTPPNAWLSEQTGLRVVRYDDDVHIDAEVDDTLPFQSEGDQ
ncbi:hypothetical protein D3C84_978370 [compost metagenome]